VHDAAGHADEFVLRAAGQLDRLNRVETEVHEPLPERRRSHFHRRRGAQSRLTRNVAAKDQVGTREAMPAGLEKLCHAAKIVAPRMNGILLDSVQAKLDRVIEVERMSADRA